MSKYHANCTKSQEQPQRKPRAETPLTSKPFCDCKICTCKTCPDILKLLCITVTEHSCDFGSKVASDSNEGTCPVHGLGPNNSLLQLVNPDRECTCEIVARAVKSNVHMNIGLSERRDTMHDDKKSTQDSCSQK